ncbi:hypothetical protein SAMN04489732_113186 [Amycolatopsis saalfeldensis]|uniref:Uncharacterized protein n=1 Tax=Amycolatopsis saalfeldensis TaxID=394193 RepID=A0A1H8YC75_9PSEU|nr:hypothetical protein SAMN04489732_113186 [Amycolatopsis saalfeldensis]
MKVLQRRTGVSTQLFDKPMAQLLIVVQGVDAAAAAIQGEHKLSGDALIPWIRVTQVGQAGHRYRVLALAESRVDQIKLGGVMLTFERRALCDQPWGVQGRERLSVPQLTCPMQQLRSALVIPGAAGFLHKTVE